MICPVCHTNLPDPQVLGPTKCTCGHWISASWPVFCCIHVDGSSPVKMECNCGHAYHCKLLDKLCSPSKPIDDAVFAGDVQLTAENFQWCGDCNDRVPTKP